MSKCDLVAEVLRRPLADLVAPADQALPDLTVLAEWEIPEADRLALARWGLPIIERIGFDSRISRDASPARAKGCAYFSLGSWIGLEIVAIRPSGEVWGFSNNDRYRDDYYINASIVLFVDFAWRWYWVSQIEDDDFENDYYESRQLFLDFISAADSNVKEQRHSLWRAVVIPG